MSSTVLYVQAILGFCISLDIIQTAYEVNRSFQIL